MTTLELTKHLVSIPSAQSTKGTHGPFEVDVAQFIEQYLREQLPESWVIERQPVTESRYNLLVHNNTAPEVMLLGHMDVVEIGDGWTKSSLGQVVEDKLYGRGSADMKAGVASIMHALVAAAEKNIPGIFGLFYCDEEYDFVGMKTFVKDYTGPKPALAICPEPTGMRIRQGVRGCFEFHITLQGKRGHAARPYQGINAYRVLNDVVVGLDAMCEGKDNPDLGKPTVNVTGVRCGAVDGWDEHNRPILNNAGNVIPDYCEAVLEVRMTPDVDKEGIRDVVEQVATKAGASLTNFQCRFDLGSYLTDKSALVKLEAAQQAVIGKVEYGDPAKGGYSDIQLIAEAWGVPCALLGPSGGKMHAPDEYVEIDSVEKITEMFLHIIGSTH